MVFTIEIFGDFAAKESTRHRMRGIATKLGSLPIRHIDQHVYQYNTHDLTESLDAPIIDVEWLPSLFIE